MNRHSSLLMALAAGETLPGPELILVILLLGFISYGLSIFSACMHSTGWVRLYISVMMQIIPFLRYVFTLSRRQFIVNLYGIQKSITGGKP